MSFLQKIGVFRLGIMFHPRSRFMLHQMPAPFGPPLPPWAQRGWLGDDEISLRQAKIRRYIALKSYRNLKIDGSWILPFAIANFCPHVSFGHES